MSRRIASGYWHGSDCWVMSRDSNRVPDCILVGSYTEEEALQVRKLVKEDNPDKLSKYKDFLVYVEDLAEWREQNN